MRTVASPIRATDTVSSVVLPAGTIGDYIWRDINADGVQDAGEPGFFNVGVELTPPGGVDLGNGAGNPITNYTDTNGLYLFEGIPADGTYTVTVLTNTLPGGSGTITFDPDGTTNSITTVSMNHRCHRRL